MERDFISLNERIITCTRCPRLVAYRENVPFKKNLESATAWRKPVPGFGDKNAWLFMLGLAPSIQGANRTGRAFTGDDSGKFLFKMLYRAGLATQPTSEHVGDGLELLGCFLTASVKCVPPDHKPLREEFANCSSYFENELYLLKKVRAVLALGKHGYDAYLGYLKRQGDATKYPPFSHGQIVHCGPHPALIGSYHPSPQNTNTGTLTEEMFLSLLETLKENFSTREA